MNKLKYALYTGCTAKESTPELLKSTLAVAKALDIELIVLEEASCCGASHLQDFDDFLSLTLNARNICYAEKLGFTMITICLKNKVNQKLSEVGLEYKGNVDIKHFLYAIVDDIGVEEIRKRIKKPLTNINIAPFYGCHNIRPSSLQSKNNGNENPYVPDSIERLIDALGGNSIDYAHKNKCCGFHVELQAPKTANILSGNAMTDAMDNNADAVVTPCPLCHLRLDVQQHNISKEIGRDVKMPILHLPQMIGLALGLAPEDLGLNHNISDITFL